LTPIARNRNARTVTSTPRRNEFLLKLEQLFLNWTRNSVILAVVSFALNVSVLSLTKEMRFKGEETVGVLASMPAVVVRVPHDMLL
jgi:ABC-type maltose transport system permease subunit